MLLGIGQQVRLVDLGGLKTSVQFEELPEPIVSAASYEDKAVAW